MFSLKFVGPASARSYKIGVLVITGWLVGWLVDSAVFSRKVTEPDYRKKIVDFEIFPKRSPN